VDGYAQIRASAQARIADLQAEQTAQGMTTAAAAAYRLEQEMIAAATANGTTLTAAQRAELTALAQEYGTAAAAMEESQARQQEVQAAQQQLAQGITSAITSVATGAKTAEQAFADLAQSILEAVLQAVVLKAVTAALGGAGGGGGGGGVVGGLMGASVQHKGGQAGTGPVRHVSPLSFLGATRYHKGSIKPGEVPAILERDEWVLTNRQMNNLASNMSGVASAAAGDAPPVSMQVNVQNNAPGVGVETRRRGDGGLDVIIAQVEGALAQRMRGGNSPLASAVNTITGTRRRPGG